MQGASNKEDRPKPSCAEEGGRFDSALTCPEGVLFQQDVRGWDAERGREVGHQCARRPAATWAAGEEDAGRKAAPIEKHGRNCSLEGGLVEGVVLVVAA